MDAERDNPVEALVPELPAVPHPLARQVAEALKGAVYPLERHAVLEVARENEAPDTLVTLLSRLPDRSFRSEDDIAAVLEQAPR